MKLPRLLHHLWATFAGYYWLPCPLCGEFIGGHEFSFSKNGFLRDAQGVGRVTCPSCKEEAERLNTNN